MKKIKITSKGQPRIRHVGPTQPSVDPKVVAKALGAEIDTRQKVCPPLEPKWSRDVPRKPGLYWTAILQDGVQYTMLRKIQTRDSAFAARVRESLAKLGLWLSPGVMTGLEPLEIAIDDGKRTERWWTEADVPLMPGAVEVDA